MELSDASLVRLAEVRLRDPDSIISALLERRRRRVLAPDGLLFIVAADHAARGALAAGTDPIAMGDRLDLIRRLATALEHPRVDGVLGSADIIEDLALLRVLDDKIVLGTMNRGGIPGASWEMDDRMTAYDAEHLDRCGLDGGKILLRIDLDDPGTVRTLEAAGRAVTELSDRKLIAMLEPLPYSRRADGRSVFDSRAGRVTQAVAVASGLGASSTRTWLKIPVGPGTREALSATTCPTLLMGGPLAQDRRKALCSWAEALAHPHCRGLVVGRNVLYPPDGDVAAAVDAIAAIVTAEAERS